MKKINVEEEEVDSDDGLNNSDGSGDELEELMASGPQHKNARARHVRAQIAIQIAQKVEHALQELQIFQV